MQYDANWLPQDHSKPKLDDPDIALFKSRSLSGFLVWFGRPLHWQSKRQSLTARSSCEGKICVTDDCVKVLQSITHIFQDFNLSHILPSTYIIYNDNEACVKWNAKKKDYKGTTLHPNSIKLILRITERWLLFNQTDWGHLNLSDLFTKEDNDVSHFLN